MKDFKGKVAVITGAGRGIGRGIALHCAQEGMKVVLAGIRTEPLAKTAADLQALGAETLIVQTDVSVLAAVENLAAKSYDAFGAVHLLVNNAGVGAPGTIWESSMDDWNWVMGVNFYGVLYGVRTFIPRMMAQDGVGHIVNVSSLSGLVPGRGGSYGVSKHAVVVLSESLYHELAEKAPHIKVSVYCPGYVNTELDTIDTADRPRPDRFNKHATRRTDEQRAELREAFDKGFTIAESAQTLFEGVLSDKLYIGPRAFHSQISNLPDFGELDEMILDRANNILNERNPDLSAP